ncbi:GNAT family N-acetyltransferase [Amycolatopsis sp. NPDC058986]|uniref:GNAT family N-acetyltransferase n=1 Tax=unclassified Amycolatopsis TaxID=2618356 RepID=UPI00366C1F59
MTVAHRDAKQVAADTAAAAGIRIRELGEPAELRELNELFRGIWRPDPRNPPITEELLRVLAHTGNYVGGAFLDGGLVGAAIGLFAEPAGYALHSHITGVGALARGRSVGFALKLHQRAWALERGLARITWTFDPLVRRNAHFNLVKLGARPAEYLPDFYGPMDDHINGGGATDRLLMSWELAAPDVEAAATGHPCFAQPVPHAECALANEDGRPEPRETGASVVLVDTPADIEGLRLADPACAALWRERMRAALSGRMAGGAAITGFTKDGKYVLETED